MNEQWNMQVQKMCLFLGKEPMLCMKVQQKKATCILVRIRSSVPESNGSGVRGAEMHYIFQLSAQLSPISAH